MEQENIRKETFLATLLLLAGTLILWKGYSYEPDSRQFPVFLGWLFVSFSILNAITLFKKFKAEKLSLSFEFHRPGFPLSLTILLLVGTYAVAVPLLGYYFSTFLFLILVMAGFGCIRKRSLLVYLGVTLLFLTGVYFFFTLLLGTRLPVGEIWAFRRVAMDLSALFPAFFQALEPGMLGMVLLGTILGIVVGSLPGLTSTMGVALLVPFTFSMSPAMGLALLGAIYASSSYAGSISAILLNIPGTPSNCCTLLDGYPMTQKGQASRALALSTIGSAVGGILSVFALLFLAPPLARLALEFGSQEYFIMALFGVAIIAALSEKNIVKGMITGIFGLLLSIVGMHPITGEARFTFDLPELFNGLSLVTALIGLYSLPEVVSMLRDEKDAVKVESSVSCSGIIRAMREILKYKMLTLRASIIGIIIGIVPGAGQSIASFIAYDDAKKSAKDPSHFGTGCPEGVLASEVSNNAVVGGSLVPAFTLGIPGNAVSAVLISGLMIHGLQPGPTLFQENAETVYSFIFSLLIANVAFIPIGILCAKYCVKLLAMPKPILASLVLALAVIGSYAVNGSIVEVWVMIGFGALGCAMKHFNLPREPLVLGLVLGTMAESELARALALVQGDAGQLLLGIFSSPICMILIGLILYSIIRSQYKKKKASAKPSDQKTELSEEARITAAS